MRTSGSTWLKALTVCVALGTGHPAPGQDTKKDDARDGSAWRAVHVMGPNHDGLPLLKRAIAEQMAPSGVNALILEINYGFQYRSHPELGRSSGLSHDDARDLAAFCREHGIRPIPMFNCLGHQSWSRQTFPLLTKYPQFDETPETPADNEGIYCRSWCPLHPEVNAVVFALMDELIEAFEADAFHVGMDEVFLIASDQCSRCRGKDPAELFAKAVNDYHKHLVDERKLTMLLWGDRLLDDSKMGYGEWESSRNGTAGAIDQIPKDIIICDWHYEPGESYPSVPYFQEKGFRVLPSSWRNKEAALALLHFAREGATDRMIGHLCTTWVSCDAFCRALTAENPEEPTSKRAGGARAVVEAFRACMAELKPEQAEP